MENPADVPETLTVNWRGQRVTKEWHTALLRLEPYAKEAIDFDTLKKREKP